MPNYNKRETVEGKTAVQMDSNADKQKTEYSHKHWHLVPRANKHGQIQPCMNRHTLSYTHTSAFPSWLHLSDIQSLSEEA